jgi:hypothetical protein
VLEDLINKKYTKGSSNLAVTTKERRIKCKIKQEEPDCGESDRKAGNGDGLFKQLLKSSKAVQSCTKRKKAAGGGGNFR